LLFFDKEVDQSKLRNENEGLLGPYNPKLISDIFNRSKQDAGSENKKGCHCFVEFANADDSDALIRGLNGTTHLGGTITVRASNKHRGVPGPVRPVLEAWKGDPGY
jgi:hypothetical protein